jgi:hypothetical protein
MGERCLLFLTDHASRGGACVKSSFLCHETLKCLSLAIILNLAKHTIKDKSLPKDTTSLG